MNLFRRSNRVSVDPKDELLKAVLENRQSDIEWIVNNNGGILCERYSDKYLKPILFIAIKDETDVVTTNTVEYLIELGAPLTPDLNDQSWHGYEAIHFASLGQNPSILECIIKHYEKKSMSISSVSKNGSTALHALIKKGDWSRSSFEKCVKILLEKGIDYNKTDEWDSPPIYWAAKKGYRNIVSLLLTYPNLDVDTYTYRKKTARDLIEELKIPIVGLKDGDNNNSVFEELLSYVKLKKEKKFIDLAETVADLNNVDRDERSFLQYACSYNLLRVVKYLLKRRIAVNRVSSKHPESPVEIAADHGFHLILEALLKERKVYVSNDVLLKVMPKLDYSPTENSDYLKCFELLMDSDGSRKPVNVNHKDKNGNYPLHYGARYGGPEIVLKLLNKKASLANSYLTSNELDYSTLKKHFDNCISAVPKRFDKESTTITFDYETLLPTKSDKEFDEESNICKKKNDPTRETDAVLFISKSLELKALLKHPLITSFLYVKWYKIWWIFHCNLILYVAFLSSLLLYIFAYYKEPEGSGSEYLFIFLLLTTLLLSMREVFQISIGPSKYFSNFENLIEIILISLVFFMLFAKNPSTDVKTQVVAFAILLAALELLFLLGKYPEFAIYIIMLQTVSLNFFKFLLYYSILIIAFAFCFHTLFENKNHDAGSANVTLENDKERHKFFFNPVMSMFKTMIMLTGEFEAGEIEFENYPITSHLIFLAFVIAIAIILLNLLNGLAISDTQEIKNEAELVGHIARAEYIAYVESILFSYRIFHKIFPCLNPRKICIHPEYLTDFKLVIYPNQDGSVHFNDSSKNRKLCLDKVTVRRARDLLQEQTEREKEERERKRLCVMQENILKMVKQNYEKINHLTYLVDRFLDSQRQITGIYKDRII